MVLRRVVVVDDHQMLTEALTVALSAQADLRVVGRATPTDPGLAALVAALRPDVVVIDVEPCGRDAADVVRGLAAAGCHVVVLTASRDTQQMAAVVRAGAMGWLAKSGPSGALVAAVRAVCAGDACVTPADLGAVLRAWAAAGPQRDGRDELLAPLSPQERRVLGGLVDGATSADIAAALGVSAGTVRVHTQNVLGKLGVHSRLEAVRVARAAGLRPRHSTAP
jgi:DNA-binding NarL/FixJ family response regulator